VTSFVRLCQKSFQSSRAASPAQCMLSVGVTPQTGWQNLSWGEETNDNRLVHGRDSIKDASRLKQVVWPQHH